MPLSAGRHLAARVKKARRSESYETGSRARSADRHVGSMNSLQRLERYIRVAAAPPVARPAPSFRPRRKRVVRSVRSRGGRKPGGCGGLREGASFRILAEPNTPGAQRPAARASRRPPDFRRPRSRLRQNPLDSGQPEKLAGGNKGARIRSDPRSKAMGSRRFYQGNPGARSI